jgi:hypothetical protein
MVFSTKKRHPIITQAIRDELYAYTTGVLRSLKCRLIKAGGTSDHMHLLAEMQATLAIASCEQRAFDADDLSCATPNLSTPNSRFARGFSTPVEWVPTTRVSSQSATSTPL